MNQKIATGAGTVILIIIAVTAGVFVWLYEKDRPIGDGQIVQNLLNKKTIHKKGIFWKSSLQGDEMVDNRDPIVVCKEIQIEQGLSNCNIDISKKSENKEECVDGVGIAGCFACKFVCL